MYKRQLSNNAPYILNAANYGLLDTPLATVTALTGIPLGFAPSMMTILGWPNDALTPHVRAGDAPLGSTISGRWSGDSLGRVYGHENEVQTDAIAYFTQGTWQINDEFALTLGARCAEDDKEAMEITGGYAELHPSILACLLYTSPSPRD